MQVLRSSSSLLTSTGDLVGSYARVALGAWGFQKSLLRSEAALVSPALSSLYGFVRSSRLSLEGMAPAGRCARQSTLRTGTPLKPAVDDGRMWGTRRSVYRTLVYSDYRLLGRYINDRASRYHHELFRRLESPTVQLARAQYRRVYFDMWLRTYKERSM
ncbi:hypothetical protein DL766_006510 [Monosporascus sp. MC13-8B]|uniref:Uncharacterized protein n=1 Tax=Monosporascus cannonballus TaxID=155416 RepID=A0ABY0H9V7_9PEZI|nr:hypothetical protein DL762_005199 [Monosporascus cannonballus]RYP00031.1 hypothetical protein DL763_001161 [Monosporascus cannonballus]RYP27135.1 hypothetical protein DL766_006510 [Monosporascus sp. MC13-8B]